MTNCREQLPARQSIPAFTKRELDEMQVDYRAEKRAEGDKEVLASRRHADEALNYEHE